MTKGCRHVQIPADWDEITPEWMTALLAGRFPGALVETVAVLWHTEGTNRRARFGLTYASGSGPEVVFVKAEGQFREVHAANGNMYNEPLLFASGEPIPVDHPAPYGTVIDRESLDWLVAMEDVTRRGADTVDATRPMNPAQVTDGVRGLARLHRQYWDMTLDKTPAALAWVQTWRSTDGFLDALRARMDRGLEKMHGTTPAGLSAYSGDDLVDYCGRYLTVLGQDPVTLLHGDAHIGNTYLLPGDSVGFLDWQVLRRGNWSQDVGYFVQGALREEERREHERDILEAYRLELDCGLSAEETWLWYRASPLYGLPVWLATLGAGAAQSDAISETLSHRYGVAAVDLDAFGAVETIEKSG